MALGVANATFRDTFSFLAAAPAPALPIAGAPEPAWPQGVERCSRDVSAPNVIPSFLECPLECPFSQKVEGLSCQKLCVRGSFCRKFHPVFFFPDASTMQCAPSCGFKDWQHVGGCAECHGPGICKRCARGLFGITDLELSEDGRQCINVSTQWWYLFYGIVGFIVFCLVAYVVQMAFRLPESPESEERLEIAQQRREQARLEFMAEGEGTNFDYLRTNLHSTQLASKRGGRGVALYFNWIVWVMCVAVLLAGSNFIAFELSDLAKHVDEPERCTLKPESEYTVEAIARGDSSHTYKRNSRFNDHFTTWQRGVVKIVRESLKVFLNEAPHEGSFQQKFRQLHTRMFHGSIATYVIVILMLFAFSVYRFSYVCGHFAEHEPHTRHFVAKVTGLPRDLFEGKRLTEYFREAFAKEDLQQLWTDHAGPNGGGQLAHVSLQDRFWVVGTSIAYDYHLHQDEVSEEIHAWIDELERGFDNEAPSSSLAIATPDARPSKQQRAEDATSRGVQTETRGEITLQLRGQVPKHRNYPFLDGALLSFTGLKEDKECVLQGSGSAFVVFATKAARDAAIHLSTHKKLPMFMFRESPDAKECAYRLGLTAAHCEPVSIKWQNFTSFSNHAPKMVLCFGLVLLTIFVWIALSLPSAIFIADMALLPGVQPGFMQNMILGLLIAVGNQLIAAVVDKVTDWTGFLYKDSRDVAVLALAFMGTLIGTLFDLCVVAVTAHGMVIEDAFQGRDAGYEPVVANELFSLTTPGYLILPYLGMPIGEHVIPYFLAKYLIRSHEQVTLRSATVALRSPEFDICWRYSDILNNATICVILLYFASNRGWMVMMVLLLFLIIIYAIDKYLLLGVSSAACYDTHRLSASFAVWLCLPTTLLAGLISWWGYRSGAITSIPICLAIPVGHVILYCSALAVIERYIAPEASDQSSQHLYSDIIHQLRKRGRPWDFFNTNPIFCLRTRCLGADETGWSEISRFQRTGSSAHASPDALVGLHEKYSEECLPFVRGSLWVLKLNSKIADKLSPQISPSTPRGQGTRPSPRPSPRSKV